MTPRQARTERRAAERKAKKAEIRRNKQAGLELDDDLTLEEEFSPELIARARATFASIDREVAIKMAAHRLDQNRDREGAFTNSGFVPQSPASALELHTPTADERALFDKLKAEYKAETNRQNAQHSTGPRTSTGKLASSRNSLKHGLASGEVIIPGEDSSAFESLLTALLDEHQPAAATEELLVNEMAQSYWLAQRALRLQNECFTEEAVDDKRLSLYMRYHTTHERAFHKALSTLMKMKKERARGFVSQSANRAAAKSGFVPQEPGESLKRAPESSAASSEIRVRSAKRPLRSGLKNKTFQAQGTHHGASAPSP